MYTAQLPVDAVPLMADGDFSSRITAGYRDLPGGGRFVAIGSYEPGNHDLDEFIRQAASGGAMQCDVYEPSKPGDCNRDDTVSIGEVQRVINMFLGGEAPGCGADCDRNGEISIGEVQKVINAFLNLPSSC
jgi:hypothetical protein